MPTLLRPAVFALALLLPGAAFAQSPAALASSAPRVLADGTDRVKGDDGGRLHVRSTVEYHPASGEYVLTVTDLDTGEVLKREVSLTNSVQPTEAEEAAAQQIIRTDPVLAPLIAAADHEVVVSGGFPLVREAGHPCGPRSRCAMYDVMERIPGQAVAERIRFVVVDLRTMTLFSDDFDPVTEGNFANPAQARSGNTAPR